MRGYRFSYQTVVYYDSMVSHHNFLLRCTPQNALHQRLKSYDIQHLSQTVMERDEDCFGNTIYYGQMTPQHDIFVVASSGIVECDQYRVVDDSPSKVYLTQSSMTRPDGSMLELGRSVKRECSAVDHALALAFAVYSTMKYQSGVTNIETSAAESFKLKVGVCQDFAHILISLCREWGILARYCVGFLVGEGETHAWVEVYGEDGAWYGIDPTHNCLVEYDYIKIAHGRDAADCSVTRGMHRGGASHTTNIRVVVEPLY